MGSESERTVGSVDDAVDVVDSRHLAFTDHMGPDRHDDGTCRRPSAPPITPCHPFRCFAIAGEYEGLPRGCDEEKGTLCILRGGMNERTPSNSAINERLSQ